MRWIQFQEINNLDSVKGSDEQMSLLVVSTFSWEPITDVNEFPKSAWDSGMLLHFCHTVSYAWAKIYQFEGTDIKTEWNMTDFSQNVKFHNLTVHSQTMKSFWNVPHVDISVFGLSVETDIKQT